MGGAAAGEVASGRIVESLQMLDKRRLGGSLEARCATRSPGGTRRSGSSARSRPQMAGMSTTLTAVALSNDGTYAFANIGDSRTYMLRDGELTQLSRDDSLVQDLIDEGHLTRRAGSPAPGAHAGDARRSTASPERRPAIPALPAQADDRLLLCSDGLTDGVEQEALADACSPGAPTADAVRRSARGTSRSSAGARDNVSAIVADVVPRTDPEHRLAVDARARRVDDALARRACARRPRAASARAARPA